MTSLQQVVFTIQQIDYSALVIFTAVGYDYILTFPEEVQYIWSKPWSLVSTLFVLARYFGLCCAVRDFFSTCRDKGDALIIIYRWAFWIFITAAELVMILRVWALYNRSRFILATLLPFYVIEVVVSLIAAIVFSIRSNSGGTDVQLLDFSFCLPQTFSAIYPEIIDIVQLILGTLMCLFIGFRFTRESLQVYKTQKRIQLNHYVDLLTREGMLYYLAIVTLALVDFLPLVGIPINMWFTVPEYVPVFTLVSRFILNLRALYACGVQGRRENDIDTAFGFVSTHRTVGSTMMFADARQNDESEWDDGIVMEEREVCDAAAASAA